MNRLDTRIDDCRHLCCYNGDFIPELFGLMDARDGLAIHMHDIPAKEMKAYEKGVNEGNLLKRIDKEMNCGSYQSQLTAHVCHEATT